MQSNKLMKCAIACIPCFFVASNLSAQTQRQQNNPLDQLQPTEKSAEYAIPPMSQRTTLANENQQFRVSSIKVNKAVPNAAGTAIEKVIPVMDSELDALIQDLLNRTNNNPNYSQIVSLTAELSQSLRRRGEILSTVYIPVQKMQDGELELHILQGTLGRAQVTGEKTRSGDIITKAFEPLIGKIVTKNEIEEKLLRVQNLLPGVSAAGSFSKGDKLGQSNAVIDVTEFNVFSGSVYIDNYGNDSTGEIRLGSRFVFNNPTGLEDKLTFDILGNEAPDGFDDSSNPISKDDFQCCFGGFSYEMFSKSLKHSFGLQWSHTQYDIGNNADFQLARLGFSGESDTTRLFFNYYHTLATHFSDTFTLGWSFSESELSARNDTLERDVILNRDKVAEYDFGYTFTMRSTSDVYYGRINAFYESANYNGIPLPSDWVGESEQTFNAIGMAIQPSRAGSDDGDSIRFKADLNAIVSSLTDNIRLKGRVALQFSDDILAPVQQFSLAGPYGVRAYPSGSFLADSGLLASFDVIIPLASAFELSVFYDIANGDVNDAEEAAEFSATIQGAGLGVKYNFQQDLVVQLTTASGISVSDGNIRNGGEDVTGRDDTQVFASLIYNF